MGGTSLVVQWLRLHAPDAGALGLILSKGTISHIAQLRSGTAKETYIKKKKNLPVGEKHKSNKQG